MKKRGTEKPIEIFVALFIILAVAMLLLKMMRDQTAGSEKQLKDAQRQQAMADYTQAARSVSRTADGDMGHEFCAK